MTQAGSEKVIQIVQVTDCHLFSAEGGALLGMNTQQSLDRVLDLVRVESKPMDLILATGDLAQDGTVESYNMLKQKLDSFQVPMYWLAGNHDVPQHMVEATKDSDFLNKAIKIDNWQIIMLHTAVEGKVHGYLETEELAFLDKCLTESPERHHLVCMHHHPIPTGCEWLDDLDVKNADELFAVLEKHNNVRAVLWGHVHQHMDVMRDKVRFMATPSTSVQFKKGSANFAADMLMPGYRWLSLHEDGSIETEVSRVDNFDFKVDYSVKGY